MKSWDEYSCGFRDCLLLDALLACAVGIAVGVTALIMQFI